MNRLDFFSTSAQVIPLLGLAIFFEVRAFAVRNAEAEQPPRPSDWLPVVTAFLVIALLVTGEAAALYALERDGDASGARVAVETALFASATVLVLGLVEAVSSPLLKQRGRLGFEIARSVVLVLGAAIWLYYKG